MSSPKVAVVILNYNGSGMLRRFLPSVLSTQYENLEVVLADNASSDDSVEVVTAQFPSVKVLRFQKNWGYAGGYNAALAQVTADYFVLLNSDVEVSEDWIRPVVELMESDFKIAACQPKVLSFHRPSHFEYAGAAGGFIDRFGYPFARGRVLDVMEEDIGQYNNTAPIFWATGAALFVRSSVFHEVGGFDGEFFAHQEEIDLCWRMQIAGYRVFCCPQSVVYHVGGGTLPAGAQKLYLNFRNSIRMLRKNLHPHDRFKVLSARLVFDISFLFKRLLLFKWREAKAVARALYEGFFLYKGASTPRRKKLNDLEGVVHTILPIDYYLKGKKTFSDIVRRK